MFANASNELKCEGQPSSGAVIEGWFCPLVAKLKLGLIAEIASRQDSRTRENVKACGRTQRMGNFKGDGDDAGCAITGAVSKAASAKGLQPDKRFVEMSILVVCGRLQKSRLPTSCVITRKGLPPEGGEGL